MRHIGFTGTRYGMTAEQRSCLYDLLISQQVHWSPLCLHHGDCTGADAEVHRMARQDIMVRVEKHPPDKWSNWARCEMLPGETSHPPLPYMKRNAVIVAAADVMFAAPAEITEQDRGGTWATIRMARRAKKPLCIVFPDGSVKWEGV